MNKIKENSVYENYTIMKGWNVLFQYTKEMSMQFNYVIGDDKLCGKNILEIGFGSGALLKWLRDKGANVTGIEIQNNLLEAAIKEGYKVHSDINLINFDKFDIVIALDVFEHLEKEYLEKLIIKIYSILNHNGSIIMRFPNTQSPAGLITQNADYSHITNLSAPIMKYYLEKANFSIVEIKESYSISDYQKSKINIYFRNKIKKLLRYILGVAMGSTKTPLYSDMIIIAKKI